MFTEEKNFLSDEKNLKTIMYVLLVGVLVLGGILGYVWYQKSAMVKELEIDKHQSIFPCFRKHCKDPLHYMKSKPMFGQYVQSHANHLPSLQYLYV